jgi:antitoxin YefM
MTVTKNISLSEAGLKLHELVDSADRFNNKAKIVVDGKVKAVLLSARELESIEETLEVISNSKTMKAIKQGADDIKKNRLIDWEDIKNEDGL